MKWWIFERAGKRFMFSWAPTAGVRRQRSLPATLRTKAGAERYARLHLEELTAERAVRVRAGVPTLRQLAERWIPLRLAETSKAPATVAGNISQLKTHILPALGDTLIDEIDVPRLRAFARELAGKLAPYSCRNVLSTLAELFDAIMGEGWADLRANPAVAPAVRKMLPTPRPTSRELHVSLIHAQTLIDCTAIPLERRVRYALVLTTGLRDGEIAGLTWADIDPGYAGAVPVARIRKAVQLVGRGGYATIGETKTEDSKRDQPLHPCAVDALAEWRSWGWEAFVGKRWSDSSPVLASPRGGWWRPKSAALFRADLKTAGLPTTVDGGPLTFHATRRSFATWLEAADVPKDKRDRLMGHVGKGAGDRHYAATDLRLLAEYVARIDLRWRRVHGPTNDPAERPLPHGQPLRGDAISATSQTTDASEEPRAHDAFDFVNRRSRVQASEVAPTYPAVSAESCAADSRVRTRSCTRFAEVRDHASESGESRSSAADPKPGPRRALRDRADRDRHVAELLEEAVELSTGEDVAANEDRVHELLAEAWAIGGAS